MGDTIKSLAVKAAGVAAAAAAVAKIHDQYVVNRPMASIEVAIEAFRQGRPVIVMDDEDRENEGDIIVPAQDVTEEIAAIMVNYTTGILCAPMTQDRANDLGLLPMLIHNTDPKGTAFTVTTDLKPVVPEGSGLIPDLCAADGSSGLTTGVSAHDRMLTFRALAHPGAKASDFGRPGHIFPLRARRGGVPERRGHTEASVDLCRLAGRFPVAAIGELVNLDGEMKRLDDCKRFGWKMGYPCVTIDALVNYLYRHPLSVLAPKTQVALAAECIIPVKRNGRFLGEWKMRCFIEDGRHEHIVMSLGDVSAPSIESVPLRIHSECATGDLLGSMRCDCGEQLDAAFDLIADRGAGVIIYMTGHEGRGIGLVNKMHAYQLQSNEGFDTYRANRELGYDDDLRSFDACVDIVRLVGIRDKTIQLLTNSPLKARAVGALKKDHVNVVVEPLLCAHNSYNDRYLTDKRNHEARLREGGLASKPENIRASLRLSDRSHVAVVPSLRIAIVRTAWFGTPLSALRAQTVKFLLEAGVAEENVTTVVVAGAQDLAFAASRLAATGKVDAVLCLGITVRGDNVPHAFTCLSTAVANGINAVQTRQGVPVLFGVLACEHRQQAVDRCSAGSELAYSLALSAIQVATERHTASPAAGGPMPEFPPSAGPEAASPTSLVARSLLPASSAANEAQPHELAVRVHLPDEEAAARLRVAVVATAASGAAVDTMVKGVVDTLAAHGVCREAVSVVRVPTVFDVPYGAALAAASGVDAVLACGAVVKGECASFEYSSLAEALGMVRVQLAHKVPVLSGVQLCASLEQLAERAATTAEPLALSLLHQVALSQALSSQELSAQEGTDAAAADAANVRSFGHAKLPVSAASAAAGSADELVAGLSKPSAAQAASLRIGIVRTAWNEAMVEQMEEGVVAKMAEAGVPRTSIVTRVVPGSYELPSGATLLAETEQVDCVVCLGVLIKGDTKHFEYICESTSDAVLAAQAATGVPMLWGVLTCFSVEQAKAGAALGSSLHREWAAAALHLSLLRREAGAAAPAVPLKIDVQTQEIPPTSLRKALIGELVKDIPRTLKAPAATYAKDMSIALVATSEEEFELVDQMVTGIRAVFAAAGLPDVNVITQWVPTTFDLPFAVDRVLSRTNVLAVLALGMFPPSLPLSLSHSRPSSSHPFPSHSGVLIEESNPNFDTACEASSHGLQEV